MADHILIGDIEPRISYTVGATPRTVFEVPFPFFADSDLAVYVDGERKTVATDYSVTGTGVSAGGSIAFNVGQANCRVVVVRDVPIARTTDFPTSGPFQIPALNTGLDRLTAWAQEQKSRLDRCLRPPDGDPDGAFLLPPVAERANRLLGFSANGDPAVMADSAGYPASPFGAELITASSAAAARTVLEMTAAGSALVMAANLAAQRALLGCLPQYAVGETLPASNIGPIWHGGYASIMTWQVFSANGASYSGYASLAIGRVSIELAATARSGDLKANGQDLSTTTYAPLYHWAKHNGLVVASGSWTAGTNKFRENGNGTFRMPDLRGEFLRVADDGRGVDSGRALGSWQDHQMQDHKHQVTTATGSGFGFGDGGVTGATTSTTTDPTTGNHGAETRGRNTALLHTIKF